MIVRRLAIAALALGAAIPSIAATPASADGRLFMHTADCDSEEPTWFLSANEVDGDTEPCRNINQMLFEPYMHLESVPNATGVTDFDTWERQATGFDSQALGSLGWVASGQDATVTVTCRSGDYGAGQLRGGLMYVGARLAINGTVTGIDETETAVIPGGGDHVTTLTIPTADVSGQKVITVTLEVAVRGAYTADGLCDFVPGASFIDIPVTTA